jgi:hypothetical protein
MRNKKLTNKDLGMVLIVIGTILIILSSPLNFLLSSIDLRLLGIEARVYDISSFSASALIGGMALIGMGIYLRKKR